MARSSTKITLCRILSMVTISLFFASQSALSSFVKIEKVKRDDVGSRNILFFEGACSRNYTGSEQDSEDTALRLDITQACAVESAARANPEMSVFVFSSCPLDENSLAKSSRMVQEIFRQHKNVFTWHQSLESLFLDTDLEDFWRSGKMFDSPFKTQTSNVARFLLLQKFGGIYLDLDFIVRRPLSWLAPNFAGLQSTEEFNSAVLGFSADEVGRKVLDMFVEEIKETFNGLVWAQNGPHLTTRVLKRLCNFAEEDKLMSAKDCDGFTVYEPEVFYPIPYIEWWRFYEEDGSEEVLKRVENSTAVHLWNSMPLVDKWHTVSDLFLGSNQPKSVLQRDYCPIAYSYNKIPSVT